MRRYEKQGSMTVEAVFVLSVLLVILMWLMREAIAMYQQTVALTQDRWLDIIKAAELFRMISMGREV